MMQPLLLWDSAYWQSQFTGFIVIATFAIGGLAVLLAKLIQLQKRWAAMAKPRDPNTPVVIQARLSLFERFLLVAVLLGLLINIWQKQ
jgi:hypothetical protein